MPREWQWKAGTAFFFTMLAVWFTVPNFADLPETPEARKAAPWYQRIFPDSRIKLGLDLQGGIHMVLGIDLERARINEADRMARDLKEFSAKEEFKIAAVERNFDNSQIKVRLENPSDSDKFEKYVETRFNILVVTVREPAKGFFTLDLDPERHKEIESQTIQQALETLRNRLDEFGVAEPSIQAKGKDQIVVQLPGMDDPQRAKNVLGRTAQLEFRIVDDESMSPTALDLLVAEARKSLPPKYRTVDLNRAVAAKLPPGTQILTKEEADPTSGKVVETAYLVKTSEGLTGEKLEDARIGTDEYGRPAVNLRFDPAGADLLDQITRDNINKRLAIILDDKVQSDPVIRARIGDGRPQITFGALQSSQETMTEAKDLAMVLRAGALPAPVEILESRTVGPSLGRDSIESGLKAILVGVMAVIVFMALYYKLSGVAADLALIINVVFILACLGGLHATLTLPGIAGILISIGMSVDANVLIYERIREELRAGKGIKEAIEQGYDRAHVTILDSNLTTVIAGLVLLEFGSGPIRGFAVTLIFGLIANYFTAVWFTRLAYEWIMLRFKLERLSV